MVAVGVAVTVAPVEALSEAAGDHVYEYVAFALLTLSVVEALVQIAELPAVKVIAGAGLTVAVTGTRVLWHPVDTNHS